MPDRIRQRSTLKAAIVILLSSLLIYRPSGSGFWWQVLLNWMHFPVFGLIALCLFVLTPRRWRTSTRYLAALLIAIALGIVVEIAQIPLNRSASVEDVIVDALGAACFLLVSAGVRMKSAVRVLAIASATFLLAASLLPLIDATQSIAHRNSQFPTIFSGNSGASERTFISNINTHLLTQWSADQGRMYAQVIFDPNKSWRMEFRDIVSDWSDYSTLVIELQNEFPNDITLTLRIHDTAHLEGSQPHNDRFNRRFTLQAGFTTLEVPLSDIQSAPTGRSMNLTEIDGLILFAAASKEVSALNLYEIKLR